MIDFGTFLSQNPWRHNREVLKFRYFPREQASEISKTLNNPQPLLITGPRGAGKTTLLKALIKSLLEEKNIPIENIFYFDLDNPLVIDFFARPEEPIKFITGFTSQQPILIVDEAQRLNDLGLYLRSFVQSGFKLILAGSSLALNKVLAEASPNECIIFKLAPFSLKEYYQIRLAEKSIPLVNLKGKGWNDLVGLDNTYQKILPELFNEYLTYGGYPAVAFERTRSRKQEILAEVYARYLQLDVVSQGVGLLERFNHLVNILGLQTGALVNQQTLSRLTSLDRATTEKYLGILKDSGIISLIQPFSRQRGGEVVKSPRVYFNDLGLRNTVIDLFYELIQRTDQEMVLKNFIRTQLYHLSEMQNIRFWKTLSGGAVDFVVELDNRLMAICAHYGPMKKGWTSRSLANFTKRYAPEKVVILTYDYLDKIKRDRTTFIYLPGYWFFALDKILMEHPY